MSNNDQGNFKYRDGGFMFEVGMSDGDFPKKFLKINDEMFIINKKSIQKIVMADSTDPDRINDNVNHHMEDILEYGFNDEVVNRTLYQSSILFKENALDDGIDYNKGLEIAFSFMKEIIELKDLEKKYLEEEENINEKIKNGYKNIPSIINLEQKVKNFVVKVNTIKKLLDKMLMLFHNDLNFLNSETLDELKKTNIYDDDEITYIREHSDYLNRIKKIRDTLEHIGSSKNSNGITTIEDDSDVSSRNRKKKIVIKNYQLNSKNKITLPKIKFYIRENEKMNEDINKFISHTIINLLNFFETFIAILCNNHTKDFGGDKRIVIDNNEDGVRFKYDILWTK